MPSAHPHTLTDTEVAIHTIAFPGEAKVLIFLEANGHVTHVLSLAAQAARQLIVGLLDALDGAPRRRRRRAVGKGVRVMATPDAPSIPRYVNDAGAYVVSISAIPDDHLHRPLIVHVGDDTVLDESMGGREVWCAWCDEERSPTYLRHEGHGPEGPWPQALG